MAFLTCFWARPAVAPCGNHSRQLQVRQHVPVVLRRQATPQRCLAVRASADERQMAKNLSKSSLMKQKKAWLEQQLEIRGLETVGLKAELAARLLPVLAEERGASAGLPELSANVSKTALRKMKKVELVAQLSQRQLSTSGKKEELVVRLLAALQSPPQLEQSDLAAAALQLGRRLEELDRSVVEMGARVEASEASRAGVREAAMALMAELTEMQAAWDADQLELAELEESVEVAQGEKELLPALAARKELVLARLQKLKAGIKAKEVAAVELRDKLLLVQRARLVGVEQLMEEEVEVEEVMAVMASLSAAAAAAPGPTPSRVALTSAPPAPARRASRSVAASNASNGVSNGGAGRVQEVSAKTAVTVPTGSGTPPPSRSTASSPSTPAAAPASPPPATKPASSGKWPKLREPEAVGIVFAMAVLTVVGGIKSAFK